MESHETLHEPRQQSMNLRKVSIRSDDSDMFGDDIKPSLTVQVSQSTAPTTPQDGVATPKTKPPIFQTTQMRQETTSTESKDTITPIEPMDEPHVRVTASGGDQDTSTENIMELNFETARQRALRRRAMGRRNSETCSNYDLNRSQTSLNAAMAMTRRQLSLTQSEPDSGNELSGICQLIFLIFFFFSFQKF